jgi:hypothetical protein
MGNVLSAFCGGRSVQNTPVLETRENDTSVDLPDDVVTDSKPSTSPPPPPKISSAAYVRTLVDRQKKETQRTDKLSETLPREAMMKVCEHLDAEDLKRLINSMGRVFVAGPGKAKFFARGSVTPDFAASSLDPKIAELLKGKNESPPDNPHSDELSKPEDESSPHFMLDPDDILLLAEGADLDDIADRINAIIEKGANREMRDDAALEEIARILNEEVAGTNLERHIATKPTLAEALCEVVSRLPQIPAEKVDQEKLLSLFGNAISFGFDDNKRLLQSAPEIAVLKAKGYSHDAVLELYEVLQFGDRMMRTASLKDGLKGMLNAVQAKSLTEKAHAKALHVLALVHEFTDGDLRKKIAGELEKLATYDPGSTKSRRSPAVLELARARFIRDFDSKNDHANFSFTKEIGSDLKRPGLSAADVRALSRNARAYLALLPASQDVPKKCLAADVLVYQGARIDKATKEICVDLASKMPLQGLNDLWLSGPDETRKKRLLGIAPVWNRILKELKDKPEEEQARILQSFIQVRLAIISNGRGIGNHDRVPLVRAFLEGLKAVGDIQGGSDQTQGQRMDIVNLTILNPFFTYTGADREVLSRATLAACNDLRRLGTLLASNPDVQRHAVPKLEAVIEDINAGGSAVSIADELTHITRMDLAGIRQRLAFRPNLDPDLTRRAIEVLNRLEEKLPS